MASTDRITDAHRRIEVPGMDRQQWIRRLLNAPFNDSYSVASDINVEEVVTELRWMKGYRITRERIRDAHQEGTIRERLYKDDVLERVTVVTGYDGFWGRDGKHVIISMADPGTVDKSIPNPIGVVKASFSGTDVSRYLFSEYPILRSVLNTWGV